MTGRTGIFWVWLLLLGCVASANAAELGGEVGILVGATFPDENVVGETSPSPVATIGARGGSVFAKHWTWYVDGLFSTLDTQTGWGDAWMVIGRTGIDYRFAPARRFDWFLTLAGGWMSVQYDDSRFNFHRPLVSGGVGQEIRLTGRKRLRWELRGDVTTDDARLDGEDVGQAHLLVGLIWGPRRGSSRTSSAARTEPVATEAATTATPAPPPPKTTRDDQDGDGVKNKRDRCLDTPAGAVVNVYGCGLDSDSDRVPDGVDQCPNTARRAPVDATGCALDSDGDGVHDGSDACPDTPAEASVDDWGCPLDRDADGVIFGLDKCPGTPSGARVDESGCPTDADADGVYDGIDHCPGSPAGSEVDRRGCPAG